MYKMQTISEKYLNTSQNQQFCLNSVSISVFDGFALLSPAASIPLVLLFILSTFWLIFKHVWNKNL